MLKKTRNTNIAAVSAACAVLFLFAWENVQVVKLGYTIENIRRDIKDLESSNTYLKKEIQTALSPEKLENEAIKLGMVYPEPGAVVLLAGAPGQTNPAKDWLAKLTW
ncbi:MAG: hypothetical protein A2234_05515 [Elusimicrobia bacterium RIFOXYA2_FULL_58_8]|nr:MAG: hypothetical protein A2285_08665 [Elusimicrobia bacterium RIFOXYA12_FULL_57_11]OGS17349.1 MAG: hypothetical protein A2234_05515 [Elusimicrobia bacterium RIFOXYA2_FULL_58_8]